MPRFAVDQGDVGHGAPKVPVREIVIETPRSMQFVAGGIGTLDEGWRWYLEVYRARPLTGFEARVQRLLRTLQLWGRAAFDQVVGESGIQMDARDPLRMPPVLEIHSSDPDVLAWPWEWLTPAGHEEQGPTIQIERRLVTGSPSASHPLKPASAPLRVLMLSARRNLKDVDKRVLSLPITGLTGVELRLVRPPTAAALERELAAGPWDVLHLDCHGWLGSPDGGKERPHLLLETETGRPAPIDADSLVRILHNAHTPQVLMSACRSAMPLDNEEGAGSLAASLLRAHDVTEVVAMAFEVQAAAAQNFVVNYYATLADTRDTRKALRRGQMALGAPEEGYAEALERRFDWMIPVLYRRAEDRFDTTDAALNGAGVQLFSPPPFHGRWAEVMILDRLLTSSPTPILIEALRGQGSSALVESVLRWRQATGDSRGLYTFNLEQIHFDGPGILGLLIHLGRPGFVYVEEQIAKFGPYVLVIDHVDIVPSDWQPDLLREVGNVLVELQRRGCSVIGISYTAAPWFRAEGRSLLSMGGLEPDRCRTMIASSLREASRSTWSPSSLLDLAWTVAGHPATAADLVSLLNEYDPGRGTVAPVTTGEWGSGATSAAQIEALLRTFPADKLTRFVNGVEAAFATADDERVRCGMINLPEQSAVQLPEVGLQIIASAFALEGVRSGLDREGLVHRGIPHPQLAGAIYRVTGRKLDFAWFAAVANRQQRLTIRRLTEEQVHAEVGLVSNRKRFDVFKKREKAIELTRGGRHAEALKLIRECIDFENSIEAPALVAMNQTVLGQIQAAMGDLRAADASFAEAVHTLEFYDRAYDAGITLNQWAGALAKHGQFETAAELLIAAALQFEDEDDRMVAAAAQGFTWALRQTNKEAARRLEKLWEKAGLPKLNGYDG